MQSVSQRNRRRESERLAHCRLQLCGLLCLVFASVASADDGQSKTSAHRETKPVGHAHNDYEHERPLLDALEQGFGSVEADIFLIDGQLLVAHELTQLRQDRTLQSLYLNPLKERLGDREVDASNAPQQPLVLLVDIKSAAEDTYRQLESELEKYRELLTRVDDGDLTPGAVTVILSGNRPWETVARQTRRLVALDGRLSNLGSDLPVHLMPLISDRWGAHFKWNGTGEFPAAEREKLRGIVEQVHAEGRQLRLWATPDTPAMWQALVDAGVDYINADDLVGLNRFLSQSN